jgi:P pilus assembly chaperone PapD
MGPAIVKIVPQRRGGRAADREVLKSIILKELPSGDKHLPSEQIIVSSGGCPILRG